MPTLRRLTIDDYEAMLALWQRAGLHTIKPTGRDNRSEFERQFAGGQIAIGLEEDGQLIGVVIVTNDTRKGWINRLAIDPDQRRKGYGEQLVHAAEEVLHEAGLHMTAAFIEDSNAASQGLFEKLGYVTHPSVVYVSKRDSADA
ncbi:MAG: GNAT family N-acetyltransferase [Chloroflexi bacterium]|nr:GNAT family N-acetyltransferase [Chloroflexota bacterium]